MPSTSEEHPATRRLYGLKQRYLSPGQVEVGLNSPQRIIRLTPISTVLVISVVQMVKSKGAFTNPADAG